LCRRRRLYAVSSVLIGCTCARATAAASLLSVPARRAGWWMQPAVCTVQPAASVAVISICESGGDCNSAFSVFLGVSARRRKKPSRGRRSFLPLPYAALGLGLGYPGLVQGLSLSSPDVLFQLAFPEFSFFIVLFYLFIRFQLPACDRHERLVRGKVGCETSPHAAPGLLMTGKDIGAL
jgi:hypothetical protein